MYAPADEKCLFIMMGVQGFNSNADHYFEGFEVLRAYLVEQKDKMGWKTSDILSMTGKTTASHYFSKSQWLFPTEEHYNKMRELADGKAFERTYDDLRQEYDDLRQEYYSTRAHFNNTHDNFNNVWHFPRASEAERKNTGGHVTPKPLKLCARAIKTSTPNGGLVVDFFGGSGSTMAAAHQLGVEAYLMELTPKYCDVVVRRMLALDPTLTISRNGQSIAAEEFLTQAEN